MKRLADLGLDAALLAGVASFLLLVAGPLLLGYRTETMLTGSMRGSVDRGSVAVLVQEPIADLRPGQVIAYSAPLTDHRTVTHRVVEVDHLATGTEFRTKGDANDAADPWVARTHADHVWVVRAVVPWVGSALRWIHLPLGHALLVLLLPLLIAAWVIAAIWRVAPAVIPPVLLPTVVTIDRLATLRQRAATSHEQLSALDLRLEHLRDRAAISVLP